MVFRRKHTSFTPINPALFLTQALRSLEEGAALEAQANDAATSNALRIYTTLVRTFQNVFSLKGPAGQERIKPLNDKHLVLQIIQVAQETAEGYNRAHNALPNHVAFNIRAQYYPAPNYPADVSPAINWLREVASKLDEAPVPIVPTSNSKRISGRPQNPVQSAPVLPVSNTEISQESSPDCLVCGEKFGDGSEEVKRPSRPTTSTCAHPADICTSCISSTISAHIDMRGAAIAVPCPVSTCSETLSRQDIKEWATEDVFARWDMLSLRETMRNDQGLFIWCQNPACYSGQLHAEGADQPIVTCVRCGEKTCFNHNVVYHEGQTCKQYERSRPIKDALNRSVSRAVIWWRTRNCPGCFQPIQKHGGCRHMSCRCGYSFTWWYAPIHWRRFTPFVKARSPGL